jgi:hypothetical protein
MNNNYDYIDLDYISTDPKTRILRNKENISDREVLLAFESLKVSGKLELLQENPIKIKNTKYPFSVHDGYLELRVGMGTIRLSE